MSKLETNTTKIRSIIQKLEGKAAGIVPSGTLQITENGTYDVTEYAGVEVNAGANVETLALYVSGTSMMQSNGFLFKACATTLAPDMSITSVTSSELNGGSAYRIDNVIKNSIVTIISTIPLANIDLDRCEATVVATNSDKTVWCMQILNCNGEFCTMSPTDIPL